jgi:hypothetical protein
MAKMSLITKFSINYSQTKLVNENQSEHDEHLSTFLFYYIIVLKVGTSHTLFQPVYGLDSLLLIEYIYKVLNTNQTRAEF